MPGNSWTLRIHYLKDGEIGGYCHQFRGSNVQVFNTTVMFLKDLDQTNGQFDLRSDSNGNDTQRISLLDYLKTIGQMIVSILNSFAQKPLRLGETTLNRFGSATH